MSEQGDTERAGRLMAALESGTEGLTDAELAALRSDLEYLAAEAEGDASARVRENQEAARIATLRKREVEKVRRQAAQAALREPLPYGWRWAEYERTRCGNKNHLPCRNGEYPHGPYWFVYSRPDGGSGPPRKKYIGKRLNEEASDALAELQLRREVREERLKRAAEIRAGRRDAEIGLDGAEQVEDLLPERPGWREMVSERAASLLELTPEEAYPEEFTDAEREKAAGTPSRAEAAARAEKKREIARRNAEAKAAEAAGA